MISEGRAKMLSVETGNRRLRIKVVSTKQQKFITKIGQNRGGAGPQAPDAWVLVQFIPETPGGLENRFFVLTHAEMCRAQESRNKPVAERHKELRGEEFNFQ